MKPTAHKVAVKPAALAAKEVTCGKGRYGSMTKACGIGKVMIADLDAAKKAFNVQVKADRRAEALARRAERQAGLLTETDERKALYAQVGR